MSAPVKFLRGNRASKDLGKTYWGRILSRRDVLTTIEKADVVVALDAGAIWAGWNLGQRGGSTPVVLGIPAARRELDQLKPRQVMGDSMTVSRSIREHLLAPLADRGSGPAASLRGLRSSYCNCRRSRR